MSAPSEKALKAAVHAVMSGNAVCPEEDAEVAARAAHGRALGLDRSVCLRDVVAAFRDAQATWVDPGMSVEAKAFAMENMGTLAAAFVEREFG